MLLLGEWERIDPFLQRGLASSDFDAVIAALDAAPAELLATDPGVGAFMREVAQAALALGVPARAPKAWPDPEDWLTIGRTSHWIAETGCNSAWTARRRRRTAR
jgi:hypothetical protein